MKTIFLLLLLLLGSSARAQLNYGNTNTQQVLASLPTVIYDADGSVTYRPTTNMLVNAGWRWVTYVQPPSNGYTMSGSYLVTSTNQMMGTCSLWITNQYSTYDRMVWNYTNAWTPSFVANCKVFRTILRAFGTTETNAVVDGTTMSGWLAAYAQTNTITPQLVSQFLFMGQMYPQLLQYSATTAVFPWFLIP